MLNTSRSRPASDSYHHGNLRTTLLELAVGLARKGGPDAVVLRDVQRLAGVSNSAAYRHYADRDALLAAVTEYSMGRLADAMVARLNAVPGRGTKAQRALGRLRATGQGYIDFALAEPGLFRTAFSHKESVRQRHSREGATQDGVDPPDTDATDAAVDEHHPFQILIGCVDDLVATGVLSADRRDGFDEAAWAAVHGLSTLFLDGPLSAADTTRKQLITDRLLDGIAGGLR
ncbi:MAG: TetR/AcrR family transcriptional regulator [Mycolicibacterium sp.]|uniref:TetR/AcrR family transcriptional regulator n=1 Tax=Mycolicibacterium sp. TaxID=2320850 RepID=UPI003D0DA8E9